MTDFMLQFPATDIPKLAGRYEKTLGHLDDAAFARAKKIVDREAINTKETLEDLLEVMRWKSHLGLHHFRFNTDEEVFEALDFALGAEHERTAIAVLCGLEGIGVPMASAILTALQGYTDDERFTVIDWRALEALGIETDSVTLPFYLEYLDYLFEMKNSTGYGLRMIDRALWQWSFEKGKMA